MISVVVIVLLSVGGVGIGGATIYYFKYRWNMIRETRKHFHLITPYPYDPVSTKEFET